MAFVVIIHVCPFSGNEGSTYRLLRFRSGSCDSVSMEHKKLVRIIQQQGFDIVISKRTHLKVYSPDGTYITTIGNTPSTGGRSMENTIAALRRGGVDIPRK
jgi:predicted RNA binding protein YcfA (HicA-like mRNA interferase family)